MKRDGTTIEAMHIPARISSTTAYVEALSGSVTRMVTRVVTGVVTRMVTRSSTTAYVEALRRMVDIRLPGKGNSNSHGARPVQ